MGDDLQGAAEVPGAGDDGGVGREPGDGDDKRGEVVVCGQGRLYRLPLGHVAIAVEEDGLGEADAVAWGDGQDPWGGVEAKVDGGEDGLERARAAAKAGLRDDGGQLALEELLNVVAQGLPSVQQRRQPTFEVLEGLAVVGRARCGGAGDVASDGAHVVLHLEELLHAPDPLLAGEAEGKERGGARDGATCPQSSRRSTPRARRGERRRRPWRGRGDGRRCGGGRGGGPAGGVGGAGPATPLRWSSCASSPVCVQDSTRRGPARGLD